LSHTHTHTHIYIYLNYFQSSEHRYLFSSIVRLTRNLSFLEKMSDIQRFRHFFVEHFHTFSSHVCHFFIEPLSMFHRHFVIGSSNVCQLSIAIAMKQCFSSELRQCQRQRHLVTIMSQVCSVFRRWVPTCSSPICHLFVEPFSLGR
jgi:hypothetical protein